MTKIIQILQAAPLLEVWTINTDFLWKLVMIFGGLASLCFLLIFYLRYRFSSRSGSRTARKTALEPVIRNYLLEYTESATDNDEDILWMKMEIRQLLKDPIDRRVITDIILEVQREALPETRLRISELYRHFELHDYPLHQLESRKWDKVSTAINELTEMQVTDAYDAIKEHINSKNSIIRKQAQLAIIRLKEEGIKYFLDTARFPISQWQQVKIMDILNSRMDYTPPSFRNWLISENQDVVLFSLRLIRIFKQTEAQQALLMFLHHKSEKIQIAALECIREFRYVKARHALITIFDQSSAEIKIHILNTLEAIGSSKDIPWVQDQSRTDESFLVRSKAGMVANALDSTYEKHDAAVQHEFEFEMDNGEDEVFEKPVQQQEDSYKEPEESFDLFSSETLLINTLKPDFSSSDLSGFTDGKVHKEDSSFDLLLQETPDEIPIEDWTEAHEAVFEDCIIEELVDMLMTEPAADSAEKRSDDFLPIIVEPIQKPYNMQPGKLTPEWIRQLEVEIDSLSGSSGYLGVLREILLEELKENERVFETEFVPVSGGYLPPDHPGVEKSLEGEFEEFNPEDTYHPENDAQESSNPEVPPQEIIASEKEETESFDADHFEWEEDLLLNLLPEFKVDSEDIQEASKSAEEIPSFQDDDMEIGCFSIFQEFFRSYDIESKLILMDEIHVVGGYKELHFLKSLFTDPSPRIQTKAKRSYVLLKKRLINNSGWNMKKNSRGMWQPDPQAGSDPTSLQLKEEEEVEYFSFSPDPDFTFPYSDEDSEDLNGASGSGYFGLLKEIKETKNNSDV